MASCVLDSDWMIKLLLCPLCLCHFGYSFQESCCVGADGGSRRSVHCKSYRSGKGQDADGGEEEIRGLASQVRLGLGQGCRFSVNLRNSLNSIFSVRPLSKSTF